MAIEEERAAHATSRLAEKVGRRYLLYCLIVPILGYLLPFALERMPSVSPWLGTTWSQILSTNYDRREVDGDIVIFGDSAATVDIDTPALSQQLGMKVINIPNTAGSLPVTGDLYLRTYLAANRPPKLIVFFMAPFSLDFTDKTKSLTYEGYEQLLRHDSPGEFARLLWQEPLDVLAFPFRFYAVSLKWRPSSLRRETVVQGHTPFWITAPAADDCLFGPNYRSPHKTDATQRLVKDFTTGQTQTLVYLAPIPDCGDAWDFETRAYPGLDVVPPVVLPHRDFADVIHVLEPKVPVATELLRAAIVKKLSK